MNIPTWSLTPFCSYFWAVHLGILWSFGNQGHSPWYLWCFDGSPMYVQPDCPWLLFSKPVNLPIFQVPNGTQPIPKDSLLDLGALMMSLSYHVSHLLRSKAKFLCSEIEAKINKYNLSETKRRRWNWNNYFKKWYLRCVLNTSCLWSFKNN